MTPERRLADNIRRMVPERLYITQGIVVAVSDMRCTVQIGDARLEGIRLRASLSENERQTVMIPKVGSPVTLGSLSGDYNDMVVLQVDEVESVIFNGGQLGGLINIETLTEKINAIVEAFNAHTHTIAPGTVQVGTYVNAAPVNVPAVSKKAAKLNRKDYEDSNITH